MELSDATTKYHRLLRHMEQHGFDAIVIGRQDNFAWFTSGGSNRVVNTSELGFGLLILTAEKTWLVAHIMDGPRILEEEMGGWKVEPVFLRWYEEGRDTRAANLVKGRRVLSDVPLAGAVCEPAQLHALHYPLTELEITRCRKLGGMTERILREVSDAVQPGMTERDVEAMLLGEYARENMTADVLLVGADDRISKYRHPVPTDRRIERLLLLHPAVRKWGLHANVTRMVYFGQGLPAELARRYDAVGAVEAAAISLSVPGTRFCDILEAEKEVYRQHGFGEEWRNHYVGGITGYLLADPTLCLQPDKTVSVNQAFDWFVTITGAKGEELCLTTANGPEVASVAGAWPVRQHEFRGRTVKLPAILQR